jgi:hypothetical protein
LLTNILDVEGFDTLVEEIVSLEEVRDRKSFGVVDWTTTLDGVNFFEGLNSEREELLLGFLGF